MILTLMIVFGAVVGGVALFGAGGWLRRELQDEHADDDGRPRPQHTVVDNETADVQFPRQPSTRGSAQPSE